MIQSKYSFDIKDFKEQNESFQNPFKRDEYKYVNSITLLNEAIVEILKCSKIGVDCEQSFAKTYKPYLCLIQISTSESNYLIDLLSIPNQNLKKALSQVFHNPNIIKVLYSGQSDILWLQRDFEIFVINYFDVQVASNFLNLESDNSLPSLLQRHFSFTFPKQEKKTLQVSEWSDRPLSSDQLNYAALDSHFLVRMRYEILLEIIQKIDFEKTIDFLKTMQKATMKKYCAHKFDPMHYLHLFNKLLKEAEKDIPNEEGYSTANESENKEEILSFRSRFKKLSLGEGKRKSIQFMKLAKLREDYGKKNNQNVNSIFSDQQILTLTFLKDKYELNQVAQEDMINVSSQEDQNSNGSSLKDEINESNKVERNERQLNEIRKCMGEVSKRGTQLIQQKGDSILTILLLESSEAFKEYNDLLSKAPFPNSDNKNANQTDDYFIKPIPQIYRQEKKQQAYREKYSMKKPAYENCSILSPNGDKLCNCNEKKVNWYLSKNLATRISSNPTVIQLNFLPSGKGNLEKQEQEIFETNFLYVTHRENQCVVCGATEQFAKFYVVPQLYRRYFPELLKSHRSQDILLLCMSCHQKASNFSDSLVDEISSKYSVQKVYMDEASNNREIIRRLIRSTRSYQKNVGTMPKENRQKFKQQLRESFEQFMKLEGIAFPKEFNNLPRNKNNQLKIKDQFFKSVGALNEEVLLGKTKWNNDFKNQHGKLVAEKLNSFEEISNFVLMWRKHFIDTMQPRYLPSDWKEKPKVVPKVLNNQ